MNAVFYRLLQQPAEENSSSLPNVLKDVSSLAAIYSIIRASLIYSKVTPLINGRVTRK